MPRSTQNNHAEQKYWYTKSTCFTALFRATSPAKMIFVSLRKVSFDKSISMKQYLCNASLSHIDINLNPRPVGGGGIIPPLWFFLNSKKAATRSAAKFSVPSRASIWHHHTTFLVLGHLRSGVIEVKLRSCSSKNEQKSCNLQTLTKARVFEQFQSFFLCNPVGKRLTYKTDISDFQNFGFAKKIKNLLFRKFWVFSSFSKIQKKTEYIC